MDRRKFLAATGTLIAGTSLGVSAQSSDTSAVHQSSALLGGRHIPLNQGWRFSKQVPEGFEQPQFDDSGFEPVCLPHTNLKLPWHSFDEKSYQFGFSRLSSLRFISTS